MMTLFPATRAVAIRAAVNIAGWLKVTRRATTPHGSRSRVVESGQRKRLALRLERESGRLAHLVDALRDVRPHRDQRVAGIQSVELGQLLGLALDPVGQLVDQGSALTRGRVPPLDVGGLGRQDGLLDASRACIRDPRDHPPRGRVADLEQVGIAGAPRTALR